VRRILAAIAFLLLLGAWCVAVTAASDYDEATALQLGVLWLLVAFALSWQTPRKWLRTLAVLLLVAVMLILGVLAGQGGRYRTAVRQIIARDMLEQVARSIQTYRQKNPELPQCEWMCLAQALQQGGNWRELSIPYASTTQAARFVVIPHDDPWGCRYKYIVEGEGRFSLRSSGPDRRLNTADDIVVNNATPLPAQPRPLPVFHAFRRAASR